MQVAVGRYFNFWAASLREVGMRWTSDPHVGRQVLFYSQAFLRLWHVDVKQCWLGDQEVKGSIPPDTSWVFPPLAPYSQPMGRFEGRWVRWVPPQPRDCEFQVEKRLKILAGPRHPRCWRQGLSWTYEPRLECYWTAALLSSVSSRSRSI
jgi:hypothetical protein